MHWFGLAAASIAAAAPLFFAGCSKKAAEPTNVLARVGDRIITTEDFAQEVEWRQKSRRDLPSKESLLEEMILREVMVQKAEAAQLDKDPGIRRKYEEMLGLKLEDLQLQPRVDAVTVSDAEVKALYQANLAHYTRPAKTRLAILYIKTDRTMSTDKLSNLQARMTEARNRASELPPGVHGFDRLAVEYSEDQTSRYRGGDVGWFEETDLKYRLPAEVVTAGLALQNKDQMSEVIKAANGFYLVKKLDSLPPLATPFEKLEVSLRRRLLSEKQEQVRTTYKQESRTAVPIQTDVKMLAGVSYPTTAIAKVERPRLPAMPGIQ